MECYHILDISLKEIELIYLFRLVKLFFDTKIMLQTRAILSDELKSYLVYLLFFNELKLFYTEGSNIIE